MFTTLPIFDRFEFLEYFKIDIQFLVKENSWNWNLLIFFLEFLQIILGIRAMVYQIRLNLYLHNSDPNRINRSQDRLGTRAPRPRSQPYLGAPIRRHLSIREKRLGNFYPNDLRVTVSAGWSDWERWSTSSNHGWGIRHDSDHSGFGGKKLEFHISTFRKNFI